MSDSTIVINSGFFPAVNEDRTYSAEDMTRPYRRLVSNGIFATPEGEPSTDFQVLANGNNLQLTVKAGEGIFGYKWAYSVDKTFNVPANTAVLPRIDSIIIQVNKAQAIRATSLVLRTGTPASSPVPPALNVGSNYAEYRIANVYVAPNVTRITQGNVTDLRGSAECPWITSLLYQVDTSVLFKQWQDAYQRFYDGSTESFENYFIEQKDNWETFLESLTDELSVNMTVVKLHGISVAPEGATSVPLGVSSYNPATDVLEVFVNGVKLSEDMYAVDGSNLLFKAPMLGGQVVNTVVLKSVISGDLETIESLVTSLDAKVDAFMADTGWTEIALTNGTASDEYNVPSIRKIGNRIYLRGAVKGVSVGQTIATLPSAYRPTMTHTFVSCAVGMSTSFLVLNLSPAGVLSVLSSGGDILSGTRIPLATTYAIG